MEVVKEQRRCSRSKQVDDLEELLVNERDLLHRRIENAHDALDQRLGLGLGIDGQLAAKVGEVAGRQLQRVELGGRFLGVDQVHLEPADDAQDGELQRR